MGVDRSDTLHRYWGMWVGKEGAENTSLSLVNVPVETRKAVRNFPGE